MQQCFVPSNNMHPHQGENKMHLHQGENKIGRETTQDSVTAPKLMIPTDDPESLLAIKKFATISMENSDVGPHTATEYTPAWLARGSMLNPHAL